MKSFAFALAAAGMALVPSLASANVAQVAANGFVVRHVAQVSASPDEVWAVLIKPSVWWDSDHTWSGDAANLTLDARAGGCFCEMLPNETSPKASPRGGVEHMRVVYVERGRALRMSGALGPLQSDAVNGTLTMQLKGDGKGGTQVLLEYVVGGFSRTPFEKLAPGVDGMLGGQMQRLTEKLGGAFAAAFPKMEAEVSEAPEAEMPAEDPAAGLDIVPLSDHPPAGTGPLVGR
ncbi:SRPBCC family protein [Novosphingobium guangzhouense]|uniref:Polyketide cyclase n=1 Tax=Novosphingobium guangzhouense TaxID=1850347 RepID=A0A2K2FT72_9SPHN|nr:SRPBCC family protein [Novosphingobium guangzhouense]PNU01971.1 polyketide cyclase [Novosphingobium guangzhouense]